MIIETVKTGSTLVSSAVPDRSTHKSALAYTGFFQKRSARISVPVKCFYVTVKNHSFLIDAGWSVKVTKHAVRHLGLGLWFASEPVMKVQAAAVNRLKGRRIDAIFMTHLDGDHVSGLNDFKDVPIYASEEEIKYAKAQFIRYAGLSKGCSFNILAFKPDNAAPFGKACDVFGDGSVTAYLTPTHSAGSVIYKITDGDSFALVVGDNGYSEKSWQAGVIPGIVYDEDNMRLCLDWIKAQSASENCTGIYCAHDPIDK